MTHRFAGFVVASIGVGVFAFACGSSDDATPTPPIVIKHVAGKGGTAAAGGGGADAAGKGGATASGGDTSGGAPTGGSTGDDAGGAAGGPVTGDDSGGSDDSSDVTPAMNGFGTISLSVKRFSTTSATSDLGAMFANDSVPSPGCSDIAVSGAAACVEHTCMPGTMSPPGPFPDAGVITVTGTLDPNPLTISPQNGHYDDAAFSMGDIPAAGGQLFKGGEMLVVSAPGSGVGALSLTVVAPSGPTLTAPPPPAANTALAVTSMADLPITWTGGTSGQVVFSLRGTSATTDVTLRCTFTGTDGSGTIPKSALADLAKVTSFGSYDFSATSSASQMVGTMNVTATATSAGINSAGTVAAGTATFDGGQPTGAGGSD